MAKYQERLFLERMEDHVGYIQNRLNKIKNDWEATLFVLLSKGFGLNTNGNAFFEWAAVVPSENNRILSRFKFFEVPQISAISSQSIFHLYKKYCKLKKCLSCQVGFELMKYK